ncbi:MAG TPA: VIT1/CCC1 transporter family protein [Terriglobales bacterium]|nr:VIT1/CCC1 transporter family protein [Terriglobales bacterium]
MPATPHVERHFTGSQVVRDIVIGMSDGLTVPFALAAGLSGAMVANRTIVIAGLAEIAAGSIAMGLGGYLAARSDAEHYVRERRREQYEVRERRADEVRETQEIFEGYGLTPEEIHPIVRALEKRHEDWVDFMMRFELGLERPDPKRAVVSAATIAGSYVAGGIIPLSPYTVMHDVHAALFTSSGVTALALATFGFLKGRVSQTGSLRGAWQTLLVGGLAAGAAFFLARLFS